jgi:hypothetical protein
MVEPPKSPFGYETITYLWVIAISALGGIVSFMRKVKQGAARVFNITEFIGEIITSGFVGMLTFWLCEAAGISPLVTAAMVGISGHMGSRAIFLIEKKAERFYGNK